MTTSPRIETRFRWLLITALCGFTALSYQGIEQNSFHFDDWHNILLNASIHMEKFSIEALVNAAAGASLPHRPIPSVTFAIDWWRGGEESATFLRTNLLIHVLTTLAVFLLLRLVLSQGLAETPSSHTDLFAALAAAWWAVQPIHVQAVSYAVQRMTELAALFTVLGVWAYLKGRLTPDRGWHWFVVSGLCLVLGALSKQNAWIAPGLLLTAEYLVIRHNNPLIKQSSDRFLLAMPVIAGLGATALLTIDGPLKTWALSGYAWRDFTLTERLLTQPKVLAFHISQLVWPLPSRFSLEHDIQTVRTVASWEFVLPFLAVLAWVAWGLHLAARRTTRIAGFLVLWAPITLLIESTVIPLEMAFEHRMYMPTVGFAGLIALGLGQANLKSPAMLKLPLAALTAAILFAAWSTHSRLPQWRSAISLLENTTEHAPNSVRIWNQLGVEYLRAGRLSDAARANDRAYQIEPRWGDGYPFINRGVILEAMGQRDQARAIYEEAILRFPNQVLAYNNLGLLSLRDGNVGEAIAYFNQAIATDAEFSEAWTNRGTARVLLGDTIGATQDLERAIALSPREALAFHYLARLYTQAGRSADSDRARSRACLLGVTQDCPRSEKSQ